MNPFRWKVKNRYVQGDKKQTDKVCGRGAGQGERLLSLAHGNIWELNRDSDCAVL